MLFSLRTAHPSELGWINQRYNEIGFVPSSLTNHLVIAEIDGTAVGLSRLVFIDDSSGELGGIYVFPDYRTQGVAEKNRLTPRFDQYI